MTNDTVTSSIRPIFYSFDPIDQFNGPPTSNFTFLAVQNAPGRRDNSNIFDPRSLGVPWPTSFPVSVQSRHWKEAERAAKQLAANILSVLPQDHELTQLEGHSSLTQMSKYDELIETGVTASINMFPASNARRAELMAKANLLIFIHDEDLAEVQFSDKAPEEAQIWQKNLFHQFALEVVDEDPANAKEFLGGMLRLARHTRRNPPKQQTEFASFADYIRYRIEDFAVEWVIASLKITCEVTLSTSEMEALAPARQLYMTHISLTNDLYSYSKEVLEMKDGGALVNGVHVLQSLLGVCPNTAKVILRNILWSIENQLDQMYDDFEQSGKFSKDQLRLFRGMVESLAGNTFYSATTYRYACVVPGSALQ
ncbi:hypothetical protein ASPTUDRAFT_126705 [Aspergillus tubingensis CBS 134.48]|uniref:Terpene synthase n=1 Tax=Aspergillus tubingensis (strain CBS 134.48) TaxID=767770 RepID=A0A1L9MY77_ASPTC|nr:hypothetical protein ASPTUDRAFT_126705 [Aspergillus tubingensis CBS 134.48]